MKNEEENFESMDSTFTPIGRADSRTRRKSKIEEMKVFKKLKFDEVEN
jgi:hypothetical protein